MKLWRKIYFENFVGSREQDAIADTNSSKNLFVNTHSSHLIILWNAGADTSWARYVCLHINFSVIFHKCIASTPLHHQYYYGAGTQTNPIILSICIFCMDRMTRLTMRWLSSVASTSLCSRALPIFSTLLRRRYLRFRLDLNFYNEFEYSSSDKKRCFQRCYYRSPRHWPTFDLIYSRRIHDVGGEKPPDFSCWL